MAKRRPSGDGMVRKRDDGRWEGRIVVGHKENGDSIFHYVSAKTQKALMEKMHRCIVEYDGAELTEDSRMTLGEWLDIWLRECAEPSVRPSTYKGYRGYAERNIKPSLGSKQISKVTAADVQTLYRKLQREGGVDGGALSPTTVRRIHGVLHQALNAAVDRHLIVKNPTDDVTLPKKVTTAKLSSMTNSWNDSWKLLRQMSTGTTSSIWRSPPACGGVSCAALCGQTLMRKKER